jgi:hypothetical protein
MHRHLAMQKQRISRKSIEASFILSSETHCDQKARPTDHFASFSVCSATVLVEWPSTLFQSRCIDIRLHAIYGIEGLVQEQANGATGIDPGRAVRVQVRVVPHDREEINHHEHESGEGDLPKRARIRLCSYESSN